MVLTTRKRVDFNSSVVEWSTKMLQKILKITKKEFELLI